MMNGSWLSGGLKALRPALRRPARAFRRSNLPALMPASDGALDAQADSIRVVGLLSSASGLGASARLCVEQLQAAGYPVSGADVAPLLASNDGVQPSSGVADKRGRNRLSIYHLNPPMLLPG